MRPFCSNTYTIIHCFNIFNDYFIACISYETKGLEPSMYLLLSSLSDSFALVIKFYVPYKSVQTKQQLHSLSWQTQFLCFICTL